MGIGDYRDEGKETGNAWGLTFEIDYRSFPFALFLLGSSSLVLACARLAESLTTRVRSR